MSRTLRAVCGRPRTPLRSRWVSARTWALGALLAGVHLGASSGAWAETGSSTVALERGPTAGVEVDGASRLEPDLVAATATVGARAKKAKSPIDVRIGAQLFVTTRGTREQGGDWGSRVALNRARVSISLRYERLVRIVIRPDFSGLVNFDSNATPVPTTEGDLPDLYAAFRLTDALDLKVGQMKVPFALFELTGRWDLPSQRRGLVSEMVADLHGFGRPRRLGIAGRYKLRDHPLRPSVELGVHATGERVDDRPDLVLRLAMRPWIKGAELALAGYARARAEIDDHYGYAGALGFGYERKRWFGLVELLVGRAAHQRLDGLPVPPSNATFFAARALAGYGHPLGKGFRAGPFVGLEGMDPNGRTSEDLGGAVRAGLLARYRELVRVSMEFDRQAGQRAFGAPAQNRVILFVGTAVE